MTEEILDIVDEHDNIVGKASYQQVHAEKLQHRVAHVLLLNDMNEVLLQLRSEHKKAFPLHWSFSIGGHVRHGESYESALVREAKEEAGIEIGTDAFVFKGSGTYTDELGHKVMYRTYEMHYDGPIESDNDEVGAMQFVSWDTLRDMIEKGNEKMQREMVDVLKRHWAKELASSV